MPRSIHATLWRRGGLFCAFATILTLAPSAGATTLTPRSMAELVADADTIVVGHARGAESVWVGRSLYTRYRIEVQEILLGAPAHDVMVLVEGGVDMNRKHPIAMAVVDAPVLLRDEHLALLLKRGGVTDDAAYSIVGFSRGSPAGADVAADEAGRTKRLDQLRTKLRQLIASRGQPAAEAAAGFGQPPRSATPQPAGRDNVIPGR